MTRRTQAIKGLVLQWCKDRVEVVGLLRVHPKARNASLWQSQTGELSLIDRRAIEGRGAAGQAHYARILCVLAAAAAKIASTLSGAKNSVGDIVPAFRRAKPSMAAWLP